ncbi:MAG: ASKHA domain-containing protein [Candidatus Odinarchaeota archaeon]
MAGVFGNYLNLANTSHIGLILSVSLENVSFIGNAALNRAQPALLPRPIGKKQHRLLRQSNLWI